jgi:hypothetical protein
MAIRLFKLFFEEEELHKKALGGWMAQGADF